MDGVRIPSGCVCVIQPLGQRTYSLRSVLHRAEQLGRAAGDLLISGLSLEPIGCSDTMGSCWSCLDRDSVPHNHPTKFKVPRPSPLKFPVAP
jgi:hypothetical protein